MWPPAPGRAAQALHLLPPAKEIAQLRRRVLRFESRHVCAHLAAWSKMMEIPWENFGKKCRAMRHTKKTWENHKKKIGGWNFAVGGWFPELPALWSKPSSRPVLLPAGQSGLCSRCQHNAQLKRQLLLSPKSGCDNWDNRLNSSWSSPLGPSAHIMSSMRLDFQEFFSRISGHWLKEGTPCWYSSWQFPTITVALLIGW